MTSLSQKLLIKPATKWLIINAIPGYLPLLYPLPENTRIITEPKNEFDGVQLFVKTKAELSSAIKTLLPFLKSDTIFWITYPKRSSGIESDLKMGDWEELYQNGFQGVASIAVNEEWAGSRFRPVGQSKISGMGNKQIKENDYANYIDVDNKQIILPNDLEDALRKEPAALTNYNKLSYSNKKEYVLWILTAKQDTTRADRLQKTVVKLIAGKKNPAEK